MKIHLRCSIGLLLVCLGCTPEPESPRAESLPAASTQELPRYQTASSPNSDTPDRPEVPSDFRRMPDDEDSVVIGIDADMSSASARSGEAIRRGVMIAVDAINQSGGLLGRRVEVVVRDHRGIPARGIDNIIELAEIPNLVAVIGGIHTPVALEELGVIHEKQVLYLSPWAAGTPLIDNGYSPSFVFRVSVRDEYAGEFLVNAAVDRGHRRIALLLERTGWGRSNQVAMETALRSRQLTPACISWFNWGELSLDQEIETMVDSGAEVVLLVANPLESELAVRAMAKLPPSERIPIISHWGVSGGNPATFTSPEGRKVDLTFLQTFSFLSPKINDQADQLIRDYCDTFEDAKSPEDIFAPAGTAHSFELVNMLATAIRTADSLDRDAVRVALEQLRDFEGMIRNYDRPFTPTDHDALTIEDFRLARFDADGVIVPVDAGPGSIGTGDQNE